MFTKVSNASKLAFIYLVQSNLYKLIDCQVYNDYLSSLVNTLGQSFNSGYGYTPPKERGR